MALGWIFFALLIAIIMLISLGKVEESIASLLGASFVSIILMFYRGLSFNKILEFANIKILITLLGIMIIVQISIRSGLFHFLALKAVKLTRGDPIKLFVILNLISALMSIFISAVATIIIMGSLTITIAKILKTDPEPYMISEGIIVDIGSIGLMFAFPSIVLIQLVSLDALFFIENTLPYTLFNISLSIFFLKWMLVPYIKPVSEKRKILLLEFDEWTFVPSKRALYSTGIMLVIIISLMMYATHMIHHIALVGSMIMLLISGLNPDEIFERILWTQIFFIAGLSVMVEAINYEGVLRAFGEALSNMFGENMLLLLVVILWTAGILGSIIDDVPIVLTMIPIVQTVALINNIPPEQLYPFWTALLIGTLGGNFQVYGSTPSMLSKGITEQFGYKYDTSLFFRVGSRLTLIQLSIGSIYVIFISFKQLIMSKIGLLYYAILFAPGIIGMLLIITKELGLIQKRIS